MGSQRDSITPGTIRSRWHNRSRPRSLRLEALPVQDPRPGIGRATPVPAELPSQRARCRVVLRGHSRVTPTWAPARHLRRPLVNHARCSSIWPCTVRVDRSTIYCASRLSLNTMAVHHRQTLVSWPRRRPVTGLRCSSGLEARCGGSGRVAVGQSSIPLM
jgi:hypothetical protein